jgi:hypothetical protein
MERTKSAYVNDGAILKPSLCSLTSPTPHPPHSSTRTRLRWATSGPSAPGATRAADSHPSRGFRPGAVSVQSQPDLSHPGASTPDEIFPESLPLSPANFGSVSSLMGSDQQHGLEGAFAVQLVVAF